MIIFEKKFWSRSKPRKGGIWNANGAARKKSSHELVRPPAGMEALHTARLKAELREGGLSTVGGAAELEARLAEHGDGWTEPDVKTEIKMEVNLVKAEVKTKVEAEVNATEVKATEVKIEPGVAREPGAGPRRRVPPRRATRHPSPAGGTAGDSKRKGELGGRVAHL